ncbi:MAG: CHAT domain-containing protein [Pseudanabaena sp. ELA607]
MKKLFYLAINKNDDHFSATVEINEFVDRGDSRKVEKEIIGRKIGRLPNADSLFKMAANFWKQDYQAAAEASKYAPAEASKHFKISETQKTHLPLVDDQEIKLNTLKKSRELIHDFCDWLKHDDFAEIAKIIEEQGRDSDENRIILTTNEPQLFKLPWRKWSVIADYLPNTLVSIGSNEFQRVESAPKDKNRILILLGHDAKDDHAIAFTKLENDYRDRLEFVKESPETLDELRHILADAGGWDILLFIGHGRSDNHWQTGEIEIASGLKVAIGDLQAPFRQAIAQGLRLVILNCCDGLGLAHQLGMGQKLHLPHTIVMQDLFPVKATAQFLEYFLDEFTQYQSLDVALSNTQKKLEQELEQDFPCVSLLPYLCRNPSSKALTWLDLVGLPECPYGDLEKPRLEFSATDWAGLEHGIMAPAAQFGVYVENGLVELVLQDIGIAPNSSQPISTIHLVLLELVFRHIWLETAARKRIYLAIATYQDLGLAKILGEYAEQVYQRLEPQYGEARLQRIFTQLVDPKDNAESYHALRVVAYSEIAKEKDLEIVEQLINTRLLLAVNQQESAVATLQLIDDRLIQGWQRLENWIDADIDFLNCRKLVARRFSIWDRNSHKDGSLMGMNDPLLADAERYSIERSSEIESALHAYIESSINLSKKQKKRKQQLIVGGLVGLVFLAGASIYGIYQKDQTDRKEINAQINSMNVSANKFLEANKDLEAMVESLKAGKFLIQNLDKVDSENQVKTKITLVNTLFGTPEYNRLRGHENEVLDVKFSPDGSYIASASQDATVRLWQTDGKEIATLRGHEYAVGRISISRDSQLIASSDHKTIILWNRNGEKKRVIKAHDARITDVVFSPKSDTIASSSQDGTIKVWNYDGKLLQTLSVEQKKPLTVLKEGVEYADTQVLSMDFHPDGESIVAAYSNGLIHQWNLSTKKRIKTLTVDKNAEIVRFSPNGKLIASGSENGQLIIWDSANGNKLQTCNDYFAYPISGENLLPEDKLASTISFSPNSQQIAIPSRDQKVLVIDINSNNRIDLQGGEMSARSVSFSPDGRKVAISDRREIRLLNLERNNLPIQAKLQGHKATILDSSASSDGQMIATASADNTIKLWDRNGNLLRTLEGHGKAKPDETQFSEINSGNPALDGGLNHMKRRALRELIEDRLTAIRAVSFSPDGQTLASGGSDHTVRIWQVSDGKQLQVLDIGSIPPSSISLAFHPQGNKIATAGLSNEIKIWSIDGKLLRTIIVSNTDLQKNSNDPILKSLPGKFLGTTSLRFSPDGQTLASAGVDGTIKLWDLNKTEKDANGNDKEIGTLLGHDREIYSIAFHPNLPLLVSSSADRKLKLWDYKNKTLIATFTGGHTAEVRSVAFSSDGETIISSGLDGKIVFWKFDNGTKSTRILASLQVPKTRIASIQITKDNLLVAVGDNPVDSRTFLGSGILLNLDVNQLLKRSCDVLGNYLKNNPSVRESDRQLCQ